MLSSELGLTVPAGELARRARLAAYQAQQAQRAAVPGVAPPSAPAAAPAAGPSFTVSVTGGGGGSPSSGGPEVPPEDMPPEEPREEPVSQSMSEIIEGLGGLPPEVITAAGAARKAGVNEKTISHITSQIPGAYTVASAVDRLNSLAAGGRSFYGGAITAPSGGVPTWAKALAGVAAVFIGYKIIKRKRGR